MNTVEEHNPHAVLMLNRIRTPDGHVLVSRNQHDYVTYTDANGLKYMVDGGNAYLRRNLHVDHPYEEMSLYSDDDHMVLRSAITWGYFDKGNNRGYIAIKNMSRAHIINIITDGYTGRYVDLMIKEIQHRDDTESLSESKRLEVQREGSYG